jgi:hypothetical protein
MSDLFIGIDPGKQGAVVAISKTLKIMRLLDYEHDAHKIHRYFSEVREAGLVAHAMIEDVVGLSGRGSQSEFLKQAGILEGLLIANQIPYARVTPSKWKKAMIPPDLKAPKGARDAQKKEEGRLAALRLWPWESTDRLKYKNSHDRADAALMAVYCLRRFRGEVK